MACRKTHEPAHKAEYQKAQAKKDLFYDVEVYFYFLSESRIIFCGSKSLKKKFRFSFSSDMGTFVERQLLDSPICTLRLFVTINIMCPFRKDMAGSAISKE